MSNPADLGFVTPHRLDGSEPILGASGTSLSNLGAFWAWSASDLLGNVQRGLLAEYLVALAVGSETGVRAAWDPYDLTTPSGITIEVKSAAYLQQWAQRDLSEIRFQIPETTEWDPHAATFVGPKHRQAKVYVFALLSHRIQRTVNPLDTRQWSFFVLSTAVLDEHCKHRKSIGLSRLRALGAAEVNLGDLEGAVHDAADVPLKAPNRSDPLQGRGSSRGQ